MAQTFTKNKLSGSTNGKNIKVTGTATGSSVTLHTAVTGVVNFDEVYIFAENTSSSNVDLTIEFGGTTSPDDTIIATIPAKSGPMLVIPGLLLNNSLVIKAFAGTANVITINGYVHNIIDV